MGPEQENFDDVRRMLALKRHEVPPPGFFSALPERVRARIRAAEAERERPWWQRLVSRPGWRPALAGACALGGVCGVGWKAALETSGRLPFPATLAQESVASPGAPPASPVPVSLFASRLGADDTLATEESVNAHLGSPPPPWLFRPALRPSGRGPIPVADHNEHGFRWGPGVAERIRFLPVAFETNAPASP